jgi:hypothetical protein
MFGICQAQYKNLTYEMKIILEYKVFDLLKNPENEEFLSKVKTENPDLYVQFLNILGNKGLEIAKQKYKIYDPEYKKQKESEEKYEKLRKKRLGAKKLKEIYEEGLLLKYKDEIDEIETQVFSSYLLTLASEIEKDPRISKYLKHLNAKRVIKDRFKEFIKKPRNLKYGFTRDMVDLDILAFVTRYYNRADEKYDNVSIIKIDQHYNIKTKEARYTVNFKLYDHENNSYFIPKLDKEKDRQFLSDRNTYIMSLNDKGSLNKEELNYLIFNKFSNALDENSYREWEIKQMSNKFNL